MTTFCMQQKKVHGKTTSHDSKKVFKRLQQAGLKVNAKKSNFGAHEMEYLGYNITRIGIQPIATKVQAIQAIKTPKTRKNYEDSSV